MHPSLECFFWLACQQVGVNREQQSLAPSSMDLLHHALRWLLVRVLLIGFPGGSKRRAAAAGATRSDTMLSWN